MAAMLQHPDLSNPSLPSRVKQSRSSTYPKAIGQILEGDAFTLIKSLEENTIDLIVTSPPYWGQRTYDNHHNWDVLKEWSKQVDDQEKVPSYEWYVKHGGIFGLEPYPHWYLSHLTEFFDRARSVLRPEGSIWINLGDTYFARWASIRNKGRQGLGDNPRERRKVPMGSYRQEKQLLLIPARFAISMQDHRWILRNDLIWYKPNVPPRPEKDRLRLAHEHFFHFVHKPKAGRAKYYYNLRAAEATGTDVTIVNVRAGSNNHSATFPEELITPRILSSSPPGGTILDPFAGTGRSLLSALKHGRNAIGFELCGSFARAAAAQIEELTESARH